MGPEEGWRFDVHGRLRTVQRRSGADPACASCRVLDKGAPQSMQISFVGLRIAYGDQFAAVRPAVGHPNQT